MARIQQWQRGLDPQETLDFSIDWTNDLGSDTISTSSWAFAASNADSILTKSSPTKTNTTTTIWLTGGTANVIYGLVNTIVTAGGRTLERTGLIAVRQQ